MLASGDLIRGFTEIIILNILYDEDDYVYDITAKINEIGKDFITISNPSLVIALKKMYDEGKVATYNELNERNVNRKFYKITKLGKEYYDTNASFFLESLKSLERLIKRGE